MAGLPGVNVVDVSFENRSATVEYGPDKVRVEQLIEVINKADFRASLPGCVFRPS
ncbi:MAG: cation transporter [Candidatus Rokuibacteriota bacterium]